MAHALNPSQRAAVEHAQGPLLVLAGAGSGKTRVITSRIQRLLERGVRPEHILAVSFTNKAAQEMNERMGELVGEHVAERLVLGTFHSFGVRFLKEENRRLGYEGRFVIFDQADATGLLRELMRQHMGSTGGRKLDLMSVLSRISLWKNEMRSPESIPDSEIEYDIVAKALYPNYESSLRAMHAVDFDDLVVLPARMLEESDELREKWRARFRHILIDEFQDTNGAQLKLLLQLANSLGNVCVVGDDDQSIYGWRGADVRNILQFEQYFRGAKIVKLEDNYRSCAPILDVANAAISRAQRERHDKTLRAARGEGNPVRMVELMDPASEARFVAQEIRELHGERLAFREMAILYRSNLQARLIEEELRANQIPYRLFGGTQFYDRKEVKDASAYLRVVVNPRDHISLRRVLNYPPRGIGGSTLEKLERHRLARGIDLWDTLHQVHTIRDLPQNAVRSAQAFVAMVERAKRSFDSGRNLAQAAQELFEGSGMREVLVDGDDPIGARRWENVTHLVRAIERYERSPGDERPSLGQFLTRITLRFDDDEEDSGVPNQVTLSTLHGAKGLEFHTVFFIGAVEGQLPHSRTTDPKVSEAAPTDVEEERRLFYVGVTRARDQLYISTFKRRMLRGKLMEVAPTRFLEGLPEHAIETYERDLAAPIAMEETADLAAKLLAELEAKLGG